MGEVGVACCDVAGAWYDDDMRLTETRRILRRLDERRSDSDVSGVEV